MINLSPAQAQVLDTALNRHPAHCLTIPSGGQSCSENSGVTPKNLAIAVTPSSNKITVTPTNLAPHPQTTTHSSVASTPPPSLTQRCSNKGREPLDQRRLLLINTFSASFSIQKTDNANTQQTDEAEKKKKFSWRSLKKPIKVDLLKIISNQINACFGSKEELNDFLTNNKIQQPSTIEILKRYRQLA